MRNVSYNTNNRVIIASLFYYYRLIKGKDVFFKIEDKLYNLINKAPESEILLFTLCKLSYRAYLPKEFSISLIVQALKVFDYNKLLLLDAFCERYPSVLICSLLDNMAIAEFKDKQNIRLAIAQKKIHSNFKAGYLKAALESFELLPTDLKNILLTGKKGNIEIIVKKLPIKVKILDIRLELAALLAYFRKTKEANQLVKEYECRSPIEELDIITLNKYKTVKGFLSNGKENPYEMIIGDYPLHWCKPLFFKNSIGWQLVLGKYLIDSGYQEFGQETLNSIIPDLQCLKKEVIPLYEVSKEQNNQISKMREETSDLIRQITMISKKYDKYNIYQDICKKQIAKALFKKKEQHFKEIRLKDVIKKKKQSSHWSEIDVDRFSLPKNFHPIRAAEQESNIIAICVSQNYDPVGLASEGAYWVLKSNNGGKKWNKILYTGLRIFQPYFVPSHSDLPFVFNNSLLLEAEIREIDLASITSFPVTRREKRIKKDIVLELFFNNLGKDTDKDGLTDLAEEKLLTNPECADTDGDGVFDGKDCIPHVPFKNNFTDEKAIIAQKALEYIESGKSPAIIHGIDDDKQKDKAISNNSRATLGRHKAVFLVSDRRRFFGIKFPYYLIIVNNQEYEVLQNKFSPTYAYKFDVFLIDRDGYRAYIKWNVFWYGGRIWFKKKKDGWNIVKSSTWDPL